MAVVTMVGSFPTIVGAHAWVMVVCAVVSTLVRGTNAHTRAHLIGCNTHEMGSGAEGHSAMHCPPGSVVALTPGFVVFIGSVFVTQGVSVPVLGTVTTGVDVRVSNVC